MVVSGKMRFNLGKSCCILAKWLYSRKVVAFVQWLYSGKVIVFYQSGYISESGCFWAKVVVLGKVVAFV